MTPYDIRFTVGPKSLMWTRYYDNDLPYVSVVDKARGILRREYGSTYTLLSVVAQPTQEKNDA